jgi:hypothetical protein
VNYLIWSIEHGAWWGPNRTGYTQDIAAAGRYSFEMAQDIVADANVGGFNECFIPEACVRVWVRP